LSTISTFTILDENQGKNLKNFGQHPTVKPTLRQNKSGKQKPIIKSHSHGYPGMKKKTALGTYGENHAVDNLGNRMGRQVLNSIMRVKHPS
jgi:hypothetical protein